MSPIMPAAVVTLLMLSISSQAILASDADCAKLGGVCQDERISLCSGYYDQTTCDGPSYRQCCLLHELTQEREERSSVCGDMSGTCMSVFSSCSGPRRYSLCSGLFTTCCFPL